MIPCLRVDLKDNVDPNVFPSKALWSEDNPDRPSHQRGRKLMLDPVTLVVWSDDIDLISPSQWARIRISKPMGDVLAGSTSTWELPAGEGPQTNPVARKGKKQGGIK